jgi:O-antigen/teichoic acid export membrane protein
MDQRSLCTQWAAAQEQTRAEIPRMRHVIDSISQLVLGDAGASALRQRIIYGAGALITLRILFAGLSLAGTVVLARVLGAENYGIYSYCLAWVVLLGIPAILGTDQLLVREVAAGLTRADWGYISGIVRTANLVVLASSAGIALIAAAVATAIAATLSPAMIRTFLVSLLLIPVIALTRVRQATIQGMHKVALGALPEQIIHPVLLPVFVVLFWLANGRSISVRAAMAMNVAAATVTFGVGVRILLTNLPGTVRSATPVTHWSDWSRSAVRLVFVTSANVLCGQADTLILGAMKGAQAVGAYSVSHRGADFITFVAQAFNMAFASSAAGLYAARDTATLQRLVTRFTRVVVVGSLPIALVMIVFGNVFLQFYGGQFTEARTALAIMAIGQFLNVSFGPTVLLLTMTSFERDAGQAIGAGAVVNVLLTLALVPRWGIEGAAVAYTTSVVFWNVWMAVAIYRRLGIFSTVAGRLGRRGPERPPAKL